MKTLTATTDRGSVTVDGRVYEIADGLVEVEDIHAVVLVETHGFLEGAHEGEDPDDVNTDLSGPSLALSLVDKMERPELLAMLKDMGVTFVGGRNNIQLRSMLRSAIEERTLAGGKLPTSAEIAEAELKAQAEADQKKADEAQAAADADLAKKIADQLAEDAAAANAAEVARVAALADAEKAKENQGDPAVKLPDPDAPKTPADQVEIKKD